MTELNVEVGKTYILDLSYSGIKHGPLHALVAVKGEIPLGTKEHAVGYRFYTDRGAPVFPNGALTESPKRSTRLWLVREATPEDFQDPLTASTSLTRASVDVASCENSEKWISSIDPRFSIIVGGVYANRIGMLIFINAMKNMPEEPVFLSIPSQFTSMGKEIVTKDDTVLDSMPSVNDLIYQRI